MGYDTALDFYTFYDEVGLTVSDSVVTLTRRVIMPYKASEIGTLVLITKETR